MLKATGIQSMKINLTVAISFIIMTILPRPGFTQLRIETEMRPRLELRDGYSKLNTAGNTPAAFVSQRTRLGVFHNQSHFNYALVIQDVRVWGDEQLYSATGVFGDDASLDVHEAWVELLLKKHAFKIGRQIVNYHDDRLLSVRNWNQNSITYDALLYRFSQADWQFHAAFSLNNEKSNTFGNVYPAGKMKTLNFLYLQKEFPFHVKSSFYIIASGFTTNDTSEVIYMRGTYGGYIEYTHKNTRAAVSAYYQNGRNKQGQKVSAYLLSADASQRFASFSAGAGMVYISGQDGIRQNAGYQSTDHLFDVLYGARHKYYGFMDYFSNIPASTKNGGLVDVYAGGQWFYSKASFLKLDIHRFWLQNNVADPDNPGRALSKALGTEIDLTFRQALSDGFRVDGGYSVMRPESSLEIIQGVGKGGSKRSQWLWAMLTFNYRLFPEKTAP